MHSNKPSALIIAYNGLGNSGVPNVIYQTIKALNNLYSFDILIFNDDKYYFDLLKKEGIKDINIISYQLKKPNSKLLKAIYYYFLNPIFSLNFAKKLFKKKKYCLVHSFKEYDSWPFFKAAKQSGIKKRIFHSNVIHDDVSSCIIKKGKKMSLKYATNFVGVSNLCARKAFDNNKYSVIYNTYDEDKFNQNKSCKFESKSLVISHVASFSDNKNQLFSLEIISELKKIYPNCRLILVGSENEKNYYSKMNKFIEKLNISKNIEFRNYFSDFLFETTFFIIPSKKEGASLVAIEAQACGINVFASNSLTPEINVGGTIFIDLKKGAKYWAGEIYKYFLKVGNKRTMYDMSPFSNESFAKKMKELYLNY